MLQDLDVDDETRVKLMREILAVMSTAESNLTPPGISKLVYDRLAELLGEDMDPYRKKKDDSTVMAVKLLEHMQDDKNVDLTTFENKVRMAIAGNVLDFSVYANLTWEDARDTVLNALKAPIDIEAIKCLQQQIENAKKILYVLDNCGEAVFDQLLIKECDNKVTLGVRGMPVTNDVTRRELEPSGLGGYPVVDNGQRMPGVTLATCSEEMKEAFRTSDLIITKGQGNFECLNEEEYPLVFLFMAKCPLICSITGAKPRSLQVRFSEKVNW